MTWSHLTTADIMGPVGGVLATIMFSSCYPVLQDMKDRGGVGQWSFFPYLVQTLNCALWSIYALADWDGGKMMWPFITNAVGFLVASVAFWTYVYYCTPEQRRKPLLSCAFPYAIMIALAVFVYLNFKNDTVVTSVGDACLVINILMYMGPVAGVGQAIRMKSTEYLPLSLGVSTLTCSSPWLGFGLSIGNPVIWIPNVFGVTFGTLQIIVFVFLAMSGNKPPIHTSFVESEIGPSLQKIASMGNIFALQRKKKKAGMKSVATWAGPLAQPLSSMTEEGGFRQSMPTALSENCMSPKFRGSVDSEISEP